jgi:hypothetical protein
MVALVVEVEAVVLLLLVLVVAQEEYQRLWEQVAQAVVLVEMARKAAVAVKGNLVILLALQVESVLTALAAVAEAVLMDITLDGLLLAVVLVLMVVQVLQQAQIQAVAVAVVVLVLAVQVVQVTHELLIGVNYGTTLRIS